MPSFRGTGRLRVLRPANRRILADPHVLLGIAIAISATIIESTESISTAIPVGLAGLAYVSVQVFVASHRRFLRLPGSRKRTSSLGAVPRFSPRHSSSRSARA
jgi:hypothetical protein